ncbi:MAG: AAA domain-containing protein [Nostoc sp.]|uniref:AAA domain-containing protein n=1 Tax=Nostoc sp. TaxID=1180 RepID=UPI002FF958A0
MSISDTQAIQEKINIWKKRLAGDSNSNPLLDFRKNKKPVIDILTTSSVLYKNFVGEEPTPFPFSQLTSKQSDTDRIRLLDELLKGAKSSLEEKGFNSLFLIFGTLTWFDPQKPQEKYVSPMLLVPVKLEKKGRKLPEFTLYSTDDDISVKFILVNKLREDFNIVLPESDRIPKLSYESFFDAIRGAIAKQPNWHVEETAHITLFQDAKAAMIKDLEHNQQKIANHPILKELAIKRTPDNVNKPPIPQEQELEKIDPSSIYQIRDADSSQQVVIEAVKAGLSCVVQGPPGTGKSQTIVNIITELIGKNKKVLVVAEKQTALEVVFDRLKKSKLEDACLNLHHQVTTKAKDFFNQLGQTVTQLSERNEAQQQDWDTFFKPLRDYQQVLNDHVVGLHKQEQPLNKSVFDLYGAILRLERKETPVLEFNLDNLDDWSETRLLEAKIPLEKLGQFEAIFRGRQKTIWSNSPLKSESWSSNINNYLRHNIDNLSQGIKLAQDTVASLTQLLKITEPLETLYDLERLQPAVAHILDAPSGIETWSFSTDLVDLRQLYSDFEKETRKYQSINSTLNAEYAREFLTFDLLELRRLFTKRFTGIFRFIQLAYWQWRNAKRRERQRLIALRQDQNRVSEQKLIADIEEAIERQNILSILKDPQYQARTAFGSSFNEEMTDLLGIERGLEWLEIINQQRQLDKETIATVIASRERYQELRTFLKNLELSLNQIKEGFKFLRDNFPQERVTALGVLQKTPLKEIENFRQQAHNEIDLFQQWLDYQQIVRQLEVIGTKDFLSKLRNSNFLPNDWFSVLQKGVYENWLRHIHNDNLELRNFNQDFHERKINEFSEKDKQQYEVAIERLRQLHAKRWQDWLTQAEAVQQVKSFKDESKKQRGQQKIRQFIKNAPQLVTTLKPCWLMSPLGVSQYVDAEAVEFDVVIFDEASQVRTENAVSSIMRAKQLIVVGDNQQLPPTSYFESAASDDSNDEEEVYENLLDECSPLSIMKEFTLRWHYRSQNESLIAFSNQKFYNSKLISFPNPVKDVSRGVHFHPVEGGIYDRGGKRKDNIREAEEIAKLIVQHFQRHLKQTLGIITSSKQQAKAIWEQVNRITVQYPEIQELCQDNSDKFFIKPIDEVQGDERDVIFFSFGFGYDNEQPDKLNHNFGYFSKIQQDLGRRRLNVAITRAKCKFVLVASIKSEDFDAEKGQQAALLKEYFAYAQSSGQKLNEKVADEVSHSDLHFEEDIYQVLTERGYTVKKRVGRSAYPIDLVLIDNLKPETEEYFLGIVCDGATYRDYPTARDRDRLRQEVLQKLGWRIYRIWSREWNRDRDTQINRLVEYIENLRNQK